MSKLKESSRLHETATAVAAVLVLLLAACASRPAAPPSVPSPLPQPPAIPREGREFRIVPNQSLLEVLVYRGGPLARAGHDHIIASHDLTGVAYVPDEPARGSFELSIPVKDLVVDEASLRAAAGPEFPPDVPDSTKEGTYRNMLSAAVLDAEHYPQIRLQSGRLERTPQGMRAEVRVRVRDQVRSVSVPLRYSLQGDELRVEGELTLRQTDLGLTPLSLLGGALRVLDQMTVKFHLLARAADHSTTTQQFRPASLAR